MGRCNKLSVLLIVNLSIKLLLIDELTKIEGEKDERLHEKIMMLRTWSNVVENFQNVRG